ncbi:MAG: hypothetical protein KDA93_13310, partial [Planctomycetaceae bacterium]|nr:hypothetical protein [Planctomycetaceae bacterium]
SLGTVSEIQDMVNDSFSTTKWSDEQHGHYVAIDESFTMSFFISSENETQGMVIDVRGGRESIPAVVEFARKNDLQLFDCSATWMNLDDPSDEGWRGYDSLRRSALNERSE